MWEPSELDRRTPPLQWGRARRRGAVWTTLFAADAIGVLKATALVVGVLPSSADSLGRGATSAASVAVCVVVALVVAGAYGGRSALQPGPAVAARRVIGALGLACTVLWIAGAAGGGRPSIPVLLLWAGVTVAVVVVLRSAGLRLLACVRPHRIAIVGPGSERPAQVAARLGRVVAVDVVATLCLPATDDTTWPDQLRELARTSRIDRVVIDRDVHRGAVVAMRALPKWVDITVVRGAEWTPGGSLPEELEGLSVVHAPRRPGPLSEVLKRAFDIGVSAYCLVLLTPLLLAVAVGIRCTSPGPAIFRQLRTGRSGRPFVILKFRTMYEDAAELQAGLQPFNQAEPPLFKLEPDPRTTPLGRRLRRTHLDELPQLVNVMRGDMSLVGPRPVPVEEARQLASIAPSRHDVRPGITGPWQVSGGAALSTRELCRLDESYVAAHCMAEDLRILVRTPARLLSAPMLQPRGPLSRGV